jgi:hypothetical protein
VEQQHAYARRIEALLADTVRPYRNLAGPDLGQSMVAFVSTALETHPCLASAAARAVGRQHPEESLRHPLQRPEDERRARCDWITAHIAAVNLASGFIAELDLPAAQRTEFRARVAGDILVSGPGYRALGLLAAPAIDATTNIFTARAAIQAYAAAVLAAILTALANAAQVATDERYLSARAQAAVREALARLDELERRQVVTHFGACRIDTYLRRALDDAASLRPVQAVQGGLGRLARALRENGTT